MLIPRFDVDDIWVANAAALLLAAALERVSRGAGKGALLLPLLASIGLATPPPQLAHGLRIVESAQFWVE